MLKIGDFSRLSKVTIKALRYYEKEGLLIPGHVDIFNGYRYYESGQLLDVARIISLKQAGLSIDEIKRVILNGESLNELLQAKKTELKEIIAGHNRELSKINYLLEVSDMKEEIFEKTVPACHIYFKDGVLNDFGEMSEFITGSGRECLELNPNIKCVQPDYCYVNYLDKEYKEKDIRVRYAQAVIKGDKPFKESDVIKFADIPETRCICIYHKGSYDTLGKSYAIILKYIEDNNFEITDYPRECYIDGIWNKENTEDWLTEIEVPIK